MKIQPPAISFRPASCVLLDKLRWTRAFTLTEMLVVIAVIATLATLLLPAIGSIQNRGQQVKCLSNIRQLGMALMQYVNDDVKRSGPYNGRQVIEGYESNLNVDLSRYKNNLVQFGLLLPYLGIDPETRKSPEIFVCPGTPKDVAQVIRSSDDRTSYWMNPEVGSNPDYQASMTVLPQRRVVIADNCAWWDPAAVMYANHAAAGINVFRWDGSAEWIPISKTKGLDPWGWSQLDDL